MDRSDSISSSGSQGSGGGGLNSSGSTRRLAGGPFGYQQRLLDGAANANSSGGSLSRSSSRTGNFFGTVSGASSPLAASGSGGSNAAATTTTGPGPGAIRRWTPSHRVTNSLDTVRGKWEERAKVAGVLSPDSTGNSTSSNGTQREGSVSELDRRRSVDLARPSTPEQSTVPSERQTPTMIKRHTMPTQPSPEHPRSASPGSGPSTSTGAGTIGRRFPPPRSYTSSTIPGTSPLPTTSPPDEDPKPASSIPAFTPGPSSSSTISARAARYAAAAGVEPDTLPSSSSSYTTPRRPLSAYGSYGSFNSSSSSRPSSPDKPTETSSRPSSPDKPSSSVMTPAPYRSSYMSKKRDKLPSAPPSSSGGKDYGSEITVGRRLGRHLPRIASGDAGDDWVAEDPPPMPSPVVESRFEDQPAYTRTWEESPTRPSLSDRKTSLDSARSTVAERRQSLDSTPMRTGVSVVDRTQTFEPTTPVRSKADVGSTITEKRISALEQLEGKPSSSFSSSTLSSASGLRSYREDVNFGGPSSSRPTPSTVRERRSSAYDFGSSSPSKALPPATPSPHKAQTTTTPKRRPVSIATLPASPAHTGTSTGGGAGTGDEVSGMAGRLRLSRDTGSVPPTPMSAKVARSTNRWGLWADTQRHLIQAYEYLCHVGEAQQWIEGCLGEELGFGVVEMDEGLRNGVVLARLVRAIMGEGSVKRIYDAPKLDFRHSENINVFFTFVRQVGLPEGFIFELIDLYDKKNIPKVIYCIHALSHLLVRRGMAERMGNLLGQLQFSDDQLERTQRGLTDAGVAMPNFGAVGRELAKEINEEPEEEEETEEERIDKMLMEREDDITRTQTLARAFLVRKAVATQRFRLRVAERDVKKLQALCRGALTRRHLANERQTQQDLTPWAIGLQALVRGRIARAQWQAHLRRIRSAARSIATKLQAQSRGILARRRYKALKGSLRRTLPAVVGLQAIARARMARHVHAETLKAVSEPLRLAAATGLQAHARGVLQRRKIAALNAKLHRAEPCVVLLQAQAKAVITRRRMRTQLKKLEDVTTVIVRIQAAVRTYLARKRLLMLIRALRRATPALVGLQARARALLAKKHHGEMAKALTQVHVITAVGGLQALARAAIMRNRHREQTKQLDFVQPDVLGVQAACRGALVRMEYRAWVDHLWRSVPVATMLQALLRGVLQRRKFRQKMEYYRANLGKVVKIQALFRAKETREQYRQLTLGTNVNVHTIKNFVHLLDDSEGDFQEEVQMQRLRKRVVEAIRENQALENDKADLDVKIALLVNNVKSFEELVRARRRDSVASHAARTSLLAMHGDPFAGPSTLDRDAKRKLELYQQLFYLLQTRGEYLSRLFLAVHSDKAQEKSRRMLERVALTLFGYGQDRREDFLLLKMFQIAIAEEVANAHSVEEIINGHPAYIGVAAQYIRPKQTVYIRETFQGVIKDMINSDDLDLEVDPVVIYRSRLDLEEMRSGVPIQRPTDLTFHDALKDPATRGEYIRHLQLLQLWAKAFVEAIIGSTKKMPYSMRFLARETLQTVQIKFPDAPTQVQAACVGRLVYYRYINPAIVTPDTFDVVSGTIDVPTRRNLAQVSRVLTQITTSVQFSDNQPSYIPINEFVLQAMGDIGAWLLQVANVPDAETEYHAHEFLDATVQPKPIYISPNEVYAMQSLLTEHLQHLASERDDPLKTILTELGGVPNLSASDELNDARDTAVTLELTNRFAHVRDPKAEEKTLWVQAKRGVLAILRVQPAKDLVEALMKPVSADHEAAWEEIVETEMIMDHKQQRDRRMPSTTGAEYRLEDIRDMPFREVKAHAIFHLLELEKLGLITRDDGYQGILNAIAGDVRSKHRKRIQRQEERASMLDVLKTLGERKKAYEEEIKSYNDYVEGAMKTMQKSGKGWKRFTMPFTKQYFHLRDLQKSGKLPQFGSFKYSAHYLYDKGILLSIDQFSPRQFDKIDIVISSNSVGIFTLEMFNNALGITNRMATTELRMEDLLQAQFDGKSTLPIFEGMAKVHLSALLVHINKKFYIQ